MFEFFRKKQAQLSEDEQRRFAEAIGGMLELQLSITGRHTIDDAEGQPYPKALGYCYGFVDAALRLHGQDMTDTRIGIPVMFHVLRTAFPGREDAYMSFLLDNLDKPIVMSGVIFGGQQMADYHNKELAAPMGLISCLLEGG